MKKNSKKKKTQKKSSKKSKPQSSELSLFKELAQTVKSMAGELKDLKKKNKSLTAEIKKIKKKNQKKKDKEPEVVTKVMEPQVLPPAKTKVRRTRKVVAPKPKTTTTRSSTATAKTKPGPKPPSTRIGRKPGPKPAASGRPRKPVGPKRPSGPEDLKFIQGLGAKIASLLNEKGIKTFADLAKATQASVKSVLEQAGPRFKNQNPKPLIEQAKLIKAEKWSELESLQADLMKGRKKPGPKTSN